MRKMLVTGLAALAVISASAAAVATFGPPFINWQTENNTPVVDFVANPNGAGYIPSSASHPQPITCVSGCGTGGGSVVQGNPNAGGPTNAWPVVQGCAGATITNTKVKPFSNAGSGTALLLVSGVASQKIDICKFTVNPVAGAVNLALVEGTTVSTPCDTGTAGVDGGATAATGDQFATNEGKVEGTGVGLALITATAADNLCILFSAGVQVSGSVVYAQF
jgi:hypothetical protein